MSKRYLTSHNFRKPNLELNSVDLDYLFKKPAIKDTIFDLDGLMGSHSKSTEFRRLFGHLKRWNDSATRGDKTNEVELQLHNNLYRMMLCIKYQQTDIQGQNMRRVQDWFLTHYRKNKNRACLIKSQNLDILGNTQQFRRRQTYELLKKYDKPYQICERLFEDSNKTTKVKTKTDQENQAIERCANRVLAGDNSKLLDSKDESDLIKTVHSYKTQHAHRRMILQKSYLRQHSPAQFQGKNRQNFHDLPTTKYSKSSHLQGDQGRPRTMIDRLYRKNNSKDPNFDSSTQQHNTTKQSLRTLGNSSQTLSLKLKQPSIVQPRSLSRGGSASGYTLMVNPFMEKNPRKKNKK